MTTNNKFWIAALLVLAIAAGNTALAQGYGYPGMMSDIGSDHQLYAGHAVDQPGYMYPGTAVSYMQPEPLMAIPGQEYAAEPAFTGVGGCSQGDCGEPCGECGVCAETGCATRSGPKQWFVRGWLDQGFTGNGDEGEFRWNTPMGFNDRANEYQMNQLYLSMGRGVRSDCWDIGGRVDLLFGTDYRYIQSLGLEAHRDSVNSNHWNSTNGASRAPVGIHDRQAPYGLAMPQLYAEINAPIGEGLSLKLGHFYSIMGYESVMAPKNFFYSHSYTMMYGEPLTHTGLLGNYKISDRMELYAGFTRGWNVWEPQVNNNGVTNDRLAFTGGFQWTSRSECTSFGASVHSGYEPVNVVSPNNNGYSPKSSYSLVLTQQIMPRLQYVIQHDYGVLDEGALDVDSNVVDAKWFSIVQYLYYQVNRELAIGARYEWYRDANLATIVGSPFAVDFVPGGTDFSELTLGANWKPINCLTIRPEARWDMSNVHQIDIIDPNITYPQYKDGTSSSQFTFGIDAILVF